MVTPSTYLVKQTLFRGRRTPILLQDVNGPCPLIALANVLFLRSRLELPLGVGEVSSVGLGPGRFPASRTKLHRILPPRIPVS